MERISVSSSAVRSVGYDATSGTLEIEFAGGAVYQYSGVPPAVHQALMGAASIGRYVQDNIKNAYDARKVSS